MEKIKEFLSISSGYGDGSGYGSGIKTFNGQAVYDIDDVDTIIKHIKGSVAKGFILNVVKAHNCFAHGETLRDAQNALEDKLFEELDVEERIKLFIEKFELCRAYPAKDFYDWHNKLTGSCEMGRKKFVKDHGIDIEKDEITVEEFINLTKNSFGGSVILKLEERLKKKVNKHDVVKRI